MLAESFFIFPFSAASQIAQEKITQVMERYRTVIALEEETRGETFPDEDPLARYGISKPIETTIGHLENNDRITVATDCACLLMKVCPVLPDLSFTQN